MAEVWQALHKKPSGVQHIRFKDNRCFVFADTSPSGKGSIVPRFTGRACLQFQLFGDQVKFFFMGKAATPNLYLIFIVSFVHPRPLWTDHCKWLLIRREKGLKNLIEGIISMRQSAMLSKFEQKPPAEGKE